MNEYLINYIETHLIWDPLTIEQNIDNVDKVINIPMNEVFQSESKKSAINRFLVTHVPRRSNDRSMIYSIVSVIRVSEE